MGVARVSSCSPRRVHRDERDERQESRQQEGRRESIRDGAVELILHRREQRSVVIVVRPVLERRRDVRQLSPLLGLVHLDEHVLRDAQLVERGDPAVEHFGGARADRLVSAVLERRGEHRCEQEQPEHNAGMPCGERPAAVHDLLGTAGDGSLGEGGEREADSRSHEELGRDRPDPAGPR